MVFADAKHIQTDFVSQRDCFKEFAEMSRGVDCRDAVKRVPLRNCLRRFACIPYSPPDHLSTLLDEVTNNSIHRNNARKLQKAIADANGLSVAVDLLEQAFGLPKKTEASAQKTA